MTPRRVVRVTVSDGDHWTTEINGIEAEIRDYFRVGSNCNVGLGPEDRVREIISVEFLE